MSQLVRGRGPIDGPAVSWLPVEVKWGPTWGEMLVAILIAGDPCTLFAEEQLQEAC